MKSFLRKILLVKSNLYHYPYSLLNLENELTKIYDAESCEEKCNLRGKQISENEFSLWEKWNFFRGNRSANALAFFSGSKVIEDNKVYIIGTIYPNPRSIFGFYFTMLILGILLTIEFNTRGSKEIYAIILPLVILSILLLSSALYFRKRVRKTVEQEFKLILEN